MNESISWAFPKTGLILLSPWFCAKPTICQVRDVWFRIIFIILFYFKDKYAFPDANSAGIDKMPHFAASELGLRLSLSCYGTLSVTVLSDWKQNSLKYMFLYRL